ncbi:MAG TPA: BTAD domain-containing putative transcriptional regulator [Ktedonosporobacter sp.]|nr:BTAD domain-containing putative transcriptional regulator [Ktedonosporobacter sp.]
MDKTSYVNKTSGPVLLPTVLHRPFLVDALNNAVTGSLQGTGSPFYKLILLCAPAGYGKTTLLADFARHTTTPCCWCVLDHTDTDKIRLLELLLFSIRQRFPHFGPTLNAQLANTIEAMATQSTQLRYLEAFLDAFIMAVQRELPERFALMLCNHHEINHDKSLNHLLNYLIQHLPSQCILVIESRANPDLELAPLLARREIFGLGSSELSFNEEEIHLLAQLQGIPSLGLAEATHLAHSFGGWITGILLSTRLGDLRMSQPIRSHWGSPAVRMERQHILSYLVSEVFAREPDAYAFLREAIVLRQMTPQLCNALLAISDADVRLAHLEQQGLFVTRSGEGEQSFYLCHPVLRELLYDELRTLSKQRFEALHRRAVELFQNSQDYEHAIYHALAVSAYEVAAGLIEHHCQSMLAQGYSSTLADWIDALPRNLLPQHPRLLLARANIFLTMGEYVRVMPLLDEASAALGPDPDTALLAEILIARGKVLFQSCDYSEAQEVSRQALSLLHPEETDLRGEAHLRLGVCACMLCNFTSGIVELRQALQMRHCERTPRQAARLHAALAYAYDMIGLHTLSEHHRTRTIRCWEQLDDECGKIDGLIGLGWTKHRQGSSAEAEQLLTQALNQARGSLQYRHGEAYALVNLGELHQDQDHYQQALSALEDGLAIARQIGDDYLAYSALCSLALIYLFMGDSHTPQLLLAQLDQISPPHEQSDSYWSVSRILTSGTILLWQQRYDEAYTRLAQIEKTLRAAGLKRELLQVAIRKAACLQEQNDIPAMIGSLKEAVAIARQYGYEALSLVELRRYANLIQTIQTLPETAHFYLLLQSEAEGEPGRLSSLPQPTPSTESQPLLDADSPSFEGARGQPSLRILALGEPAVYLNEVLVRRWRMARTMELLFFLLHAEQPVHKEQISVALWPNVDEPIDQALRSSIYFLRKLLGVSCVVSHGGSYQLDLTSVFGQQVWYDVAVFREYYTMAKAAQTAGDSVAARSAFQEMTRLYRGNYVQSFYSDWCASCRNELRYAYIDAHHQLALIAWDQEQIDECIAHWHHLLSVDNCLEEAYYGLINCYLRQGRRGLAMRQYQRCVEVLDAELAVAPGQAIQALYQNLINS